MTGALQGQHAGSRRVKVQRNFCRSRGCPGEPSCGAEPLAERGDRRSEIILFMVDIGLKSLIKCDYAVLYKYVCILNTQKPRSNPSRIRRGACERKESELVGGRSSILGRLSQIV